MTSAAEDPLPKDTADARPADLTLPEAVMLLLFDPRSGTFTGEGLSLMYTLGGAILIELAARGHIELDHEQRRARAVGHGPEDSLLRGAWERVPRSTTGIRGLVVDIGTRSRESTLNRLVARGDIRQEPHRLLGIFPTHVLSGGDTGVRDRLLVPVRSVLVDGTDPDTRTATLGALLSASKSLAAMHADIPWSGDVYTRGKDLERGDWGAKATADIILSSVVAQIVGTAFATTLATLTQPD
ncbi:GPP34 family phosphoprotein [Promicromonospora sp. NPDC060271]|uniref:GOLPH3/VPS74 family protein n=1 Tax=Promicromonospora sp. NPDC060271 TaxID=3347089 RepID=UPI003651D6DB